MIQFTNFAIRTAYGEGDVVFYGNNFYLYGLTIPASNITTPDIDGRAYKLTFTSDEVQAIVNAAVDSAINTAINSTIRTLVGEVVDEKVDAKITAALSPPEIAEVEPVVIRQNSAYSAYLSSAGASVLAREWSVSDGMLPTEMSLDADTGEINGTPSEMQEATTVTVQCETVFGTRTRDISFEVQGTPVFGRISLPTMRATQAMTSYPIPIDAVPSATVIVVSGSLPAGVTLSSEGEWSGTPSAAGSGSVTIRATNSIGHADTTISWTVQQNHVAPSFSTPAQLFTWFKDYEVNTLSPNRIVVSGRPTPTLSITSGNWGGGVTMASDGALTGEPDAIDTTADNVTIQASNRLGSVSRTFQHRVLKSVPSLPGSHSTVQCTRALTTTLDVKALLTNDVDPPNLKWDLDLTSESSINQWC